jgi:multidrug resistance protein, MATE family
VYEELRSYFAYGIPSAVMIILEWTSFEMINIFAGWLSLVEFNASIAISNFSNLLFMFSFGLSESTSVLVGNSIGAGKIGLAMNYIKISVTLTIGLASIVILGV